MSERLNFRDRRLVRSFMRRGLIIALVVMIVSIIFSCFLAYKKPEMEEIANQIMMGGLVLAIIVMWFMNKRYIKDLSVGSKIIDKGLIMSKMESGNVLSIRVNGKDFIVEKDFWDCVSEGDEVELHYSYKSKNLLELRLKDKAVSNYY